MPEETPEGYKDPLLGRPFLDGKRFQFNPNGTFEVMEPSREEEEPRDEGPREEDLREEGPREEDLREEGPREEDLREEGPREEDLREEGPREEDLREEGPREEGPREEGATAGLEDTAATEGRRGGPTPKVLLR
ncbi:pollen-specific leucine-rich repeat extensin-like protein 1 [Penaeus chinensis]|uniref:pollen-specific leucine-rich repeat extensin-like protein 1 n=1 Tax=Penaeus chinensis TaxID=139456 RepID=UPI001FB73642|nr:pollen-specific leucine-rich repeat extensin-like protein 1 [Penaeus chinensis]